MNVKNGDDVVQKLLDLIDQQTKLMQEEKPITEKEIAEYRERFVKIRELIEELKEVKRQNAFRARSYAPEAIRRLLNQPFANVRPSHGNVIQITEFAQQGDIIFAVYCACLLTLGM